MSPSLRVLLRLRSGFGVGDTVAFSVILKHLAKYRPHWQVEVSAARWAVPVLRGHCHKVIWDASDEGRYNVVTDLAWHDPGVCYADRPSTKTAYFLGMTFGIDYDAALGQYECLIPPLEVQWAARYWQGVNQKIVVVHPAGARPDKQKDLFADEVEALCRFISEQGWFPLMLSKAYPAIPDAAHLAALVGHADAFVGVDSGPAKIASCTKTPSLVVWTGHHPVQHFDPMPVTHLVPEQHAALLPGNSVGSSAATYFREHYDFRTYPGRDRLLAGIQRWLSERLA